MPCTQPISAYRRIGGGITFQGKDGTLPLKISCGRCIGCRLQRKSDWATRILHEAQIHLEAGRPSSFITLTYDEEHLPADRGLDIKHWQDFAKRTRKALGPFRFFQCGEYGAETLRPHYHAILFGLDFSTDRIPERKNAYGDQLWASPTLEKLWGHGHATIGAVTPRTAAYVAKYCTKKITGAAAIQHYTRTDGRIRWIVPPEQATMSLKPGIGALWFNKYSRDIFPSDQTIVAGKRVHTPTYYDTLHERKDLTSHEQIKKHRKAKIKPMTEQQLQATQTILEARIKLKKETL